MSNACKAKTALGRRCKLRTKTNNQYCWVHLTKYYGVKIAPGISGRGLFATRHFPPRTPIVPYTGKIYKQQHEGDYVVEVGGNRFIDASDPLRSGIARFANSCRPIDVKHKLCKGNNSDFVKKGPTNTVNIVSNKNIYPDQEIFVSYGRDYWRFK